VRGFWRRRSSSEVVSPAGIVRLVASAGIGFTTKREIAAVTATNVSTAVLNEPWRKGGIVDRDEDHASHTRRERIMTPGRLEAFADGVFAIAATLLVIDVGLPGGSTAALGRQLLEIWPQYAAYAISFVTIGIMWVNHHRLVRQLERVDERFLFLNLGLLACIAFVPFPTRILAEFVRGSDGRAAALLYGVTLTMTAVFFSAVWLYASRGGRLLHADIDPKEVSGITRSYLPGTPMYAAATLVAFVSPQASALLFGLLAVFYMVSSSFFGRTATEYDA